MQLDLFAHSRDVMLRNDVIDALRARDVPAGRKALARLAAECPQDTLLAPATCLLDQLARRATPFADPLAVQQAARRMDSEVCGAAIQVFGPAKADEWLVPLWLALAEAAARLSYHPDIPEAHATGLFIRARQWHAARAAADSIASWRRMPVPLAWMTEIRFNLDGLEAAWPLLAELAWRDAPRFAALARHLDALALARLLRDFDRDFVAADDVHFTWFPAWALIVEPALAAALRTAQTPEQSPPEQAAHTVMQLLTLERQGRHHEVVAKRKALRALHQELFEHYMRTRA